MEVLGLERCKSLRVVVGGVDDEGKEAGRSEGVEVEEEVVPVANETKDEGWADL